MEDRYSCAKALAETIIRRYPNPGDYPIAGWSYSQGYMLWGMIKLWEATGDRAYCDYVLLYAQNAVGPDGELFLFKGDSMDDMLPGSVLVWAYEQTGLEKYRKACETIRAAFDVYPRTAEGGFFHSKNLPEEMWVDGVFMGQMFLSLYGKKIGASRYCFDEAANQLQRIKTYCEKNGTGLLYHAYSADRRPAWADKNTGLSPEVWSEGLGWYALTLVEVLERMSPSHPKRAQLVLQLQGLLEGLKKTQDKRHFLWYQVVDKGDRPDNWMDTSGSAMFLYTLQKAITLHLADPAEYQPAVTNGYAALLQRAKVNERGLVDIITACDGVGVQLSYDDYVHYPISDNAKEAVASFLWAACAVESAQGII